jgi:hypothetical protein
MLAKVPVETVTEFSSEHLPVIYYLMLQLRFSVGCKCETLRFLKLQQLEQHYVLQVVI